MEHRPRRLGDIDLLTVTPDAVDAHPLIREYFAKQLHDTRSDAFRAAHSRLFDHLCRTTEDRPETLDGLQPLYQAVVHGCLAGRHQEACDRVYFARILRGSGAPYGFYSLNKLGATGADLAAVAAFFDEPWSRISPTITEGDRAWLLGVTAFLLRSLGRLTEALQPMRTSLQMLVQEEDWRRATIGASNLSELEVTLGRLTDAMADARRSITYADQSGYPFQAIVSRTTAADALQQSGRRVEAGTLFAEAERILKEEWPSDLLNSGNGFRYCEWLLAPAERFAWRILLRGPGLPIGGDEHGEEDPATICDAVERRAETTLAWIIPETPLLNIALDHLSLARVGLVRALLARPLPQPTLDLPHVAAAVGGFRDAGTIHLMPKGLLTAAIYHFVRGDFASARAPLDQAQEIAERGPMPLDLADVHLHRARLFRDRAELARARDLIKTHGYGRRDEELADAEAAARDWPAC